MAGCRLWGEGGGSQPVRAQMGLHSGPHSSISLSGSWGRCRNLEETGLGEGPHRAPPLAGPFRVLGAPYPRKKGGEAEEEAATSADPDALGADGPGACVSARKKDGESSAAQRPGRGKKGCCSRVGAPDCHRGPWEGPGPREEPGPTGTGTGRSRDDGRAGRSKGGDRPPRQAPT